MAETIVAYFLFSCSVTGTRKRQVMDMVLDLAGEGPIPADGLVGRAFDNGIGGPGQAYNYYRPVLVSYLLRFTGHFKEPDEQGRRDALVDAWTFRRWLMGDGDAADGGRSRVSRPR